MSEGSLVARRSDFDGVMNDEDISNVDVNKKMLKFVNNAKNMLKNQKNRKRNKLRVRKKEPEKEKL